MKTEIGKLTIHFENTFDEKEVSIFTEYVGNELQADSDAVVGFDGDWTAVFDISKCTLSENEISDVILKYLDKCNMESNRINFPSTKTLKIN